MLDSLFGKCTSLTHFQSIVGLVDQVANVLKTSFGGPLEQETLDLIMSLIGSAAKTPTVPPIATPAAPESTTSTPAQ